MFDRTLFAQRLTDALTHSGKKQKGIAEELKVSEQTISSYKHGGKIPSLDTVVNLAEILNVSLDWLVGLPNKDKKGKNSKFETLEDVVSCLEEIGERMELTTSIEVVEERNLNMQDICDDPYIQRELPTFRFRRFVPPLTQYFRKRDKMQSLVEDGTIEPEMFDSWVKGEMEKLKDISIVNGRRFAMSKEMCELFAGDGELPF